MPELSRRQLMSGAALAAGAVALRPAVATASDARIPEATGYDLEVVVICRQGYSSSLAAASLRAIGLHGATDLIGGVEQWLLEGLPMSDAAADVRE